MEKTAIYKRTALTAAFIVFFPAAVSAAVSQFAFTTTAQSIAKSVISEPITVQSQDLQGNSTPVTQTACLRFNSASAQGQFSSSATNWNPISVLTMSKNTSNKNFYYKDDTEGTHALSVQISLKPESESRSCASWPVEEWNIQWTTTQNIIIGNTQSNSTSTAETTTAASTQNTNSAASAPIPSYVAPPQPKIFADAGADRTVIVAADSVFSGRAYDRKQETLSGNIRFLWNFGDGRTAEGASVLHHFDYPGRYAVILSIADNFDAASDRIIVTAEPAKLFFAAAADGSVLIQNLAGRDLDLSRWILRSMGRQFVLPADSIVLAGETLRIGEQVLGFRSTSGGELDYPNGTLALRAGEGSQATSSVAEKPAAEAPARTLEIPPAQNPVKETVSASIINEHRDVSSELSDSPLIVPTTTEQATLAAAAGDALPSGPSAWWLSALGVAMLGVGGIVAARRAGKREWKIIDDSEK